MALVRSRSRGGDAAPRRLRALIVIAVAGALAAPVAGHASGGAATGAVTASPVARSARIWPLGDSITYGASWPRPTPGGYRTALDQILTREDFSHRFVGTWRLNSSPTLDADGEAAHDGHSGYRVDQVARDLDGLAHGGTDNGGHWLTGTPRRAALTPDVVLIHLGTNDVLQDWDPRRFPTRTGRAALSNPRQRAEFVADLTRRLATLLDRIQALRPRTELVVATVTPIDTPVLGSVVATYAVSVRRLVAVLRAKGMPITLADVYAAFTLPGARGSSVLPGLLSGDRVHPSALGYAVMARTFAAAIETH